MNHAIMETPGVHYGLPDDHYHALDEYLSSSRLKLMIMQSPQHYITNAHKDSPAMATGRLVHALLADPAGFLKNNRVVEASTKTTGIYRKANAEMPGRVFLQKEIDAAFDTVLAIQSNEWAQPLTAGAEYETSFFWKEGNYLAKARTDVWQPHTGVVSDYKIVDDASPDAVRRAVMKYGWHYSAQWYSRGIAANGYPFDSWYWICAEKKPPFAVQVYRCAPEWLEYASAKIDLALKQIEVCKTSNHWPSYCDGVHYLGMPNWIAD